MKEYYTINYINGNREYVLGILSKIEKEILKRIWKEKKIFNIINNKGIEVLKL